MRNIILIITMVTFLPFVFANGEVDDGHEAEPIEQFEVPQRNATADIGVFLIITALPFIITWLVYHHRKMSHKEIQLKIRKYL